ncbi:outer membrane protein assembly factor BamE [Polynucleobacter sp. MWH-P3-07-1]|nr:outer membrane protein assembly factor BamE [Polynucleobacter sp. MWH-P3-07-1]
MQNCSQLFSRFLKPSTEGFYASLRLIGFLGLLLGVLGMSACSTAVDDTQRVWANKIFQPYVPDVVQGNFISSEQYSKLELGMSREQVRQIMGTPLLADYFHANRWDYVFEFKRDGQKIAKDRRVTIFFDGNKVVKFDGDALPTEVELVAEIDGYSKVKRSFWQRITGTGKGPVTPPLQQPELLVPSKTEAVSTSSTLPAGATTTSDNNTTTTKQ